MQVAVARVEDVRDSDASLEGQLLDVAQDFWQCRSRHDPVLDDVVRTDPPHGRECRLASSPDLRAFGVVERLTQFQRTCRAAMLFDPDAVSLDLCLGSI